MVAIHQPLTLRWREVRKGVLDKVSFIIIPQLFCEDGDTDGFVGAQAHTSEGVSVWMEVFSVWMLYHSNVI